MQFEEYEPLSTREAMFIEAIEDKSIDNPPTTDSAMNPQQEQDSMSDSSDDDGLKTEGSQLTYKPFLNIFGKQ